MIRMPLKMPAPYVSMSGFCGWFHLWNSISYWYGSEEETVTAGVVGFLQHAWEICLEFLTLVFGPGH